MLTFEWTDAYLGSPNQNLNKSQLDDELRKFRRGIREVMGRQHDWGPGTGNTGKHKAGAIELVQFGDIATRDAIASPVPGLCFIVQDAGISELWVYMDSSWNKVGTNDHAALSNLSEDAHPQYYKNANETIEGEGEIAAAGYDIQFESEPAEIENGLVTSAHLLHTHSPIGSADALSLANVGNAKLSKDFIDISHSSVSGDPVNPDPADFVDFSQGYPCSVPNIQVECPSYPTGPNSSYPTLNLAGAYVYLLSDGLRMLKLASDYGVYYPTTWHVKAVRFNP